MWVVVKSSKTNMRKQIKDNLPPDPFSDFCKSQGIKVVDVTPVTPTVKGVGWDVKKWRELFVSMGMNPQPRSVIARLFHEMEIEVCTAVLSARKDALKEAKEMAHIVRVPARARSLDWRAGYAQGKQDISSAIENLNQYQ